MYKNEMEIDVFRCIKSIYKKKGFILIFTLLFFIIGYGLTLDIGEDKYTSVATVYAASDSSYSDATAAVTAMNAYLDVAKSYKVSQRAALILGRNDIDATEIQSSLSVESSARNQGTTNITNFMNSSATIISFYATTVDPELSRQIADAAAESYVIEMANILKMDSVKSLDSASIGTLSRNASAEAWKSRIRVTIVGLIVSCMIVLIFEIFNSKVRTVREATIRNQIPVIGIIPDFKE